MQIVIIVVDALISIHALLAESDVFKLQCILGGRYFYPRSPCGERHTWQRGSRITYVISIHALLAESDKRAENHASSQQEFLSTLSLRRATSQRDKRHPHCEISIHALLAESDNRFISSCRLPTAFLSTLSLRRATSDKNDSDKNWPFLSTLSLRRATVKLSVSGSAINISIHALLAESD